VHRDGDNGSLWVHLEPVGLHRGASGVLLGYGTAQMFGDVSAITAPAASAYLGLLGLPPGAIGLIKWRLSKDNGISDEQV